MKQNLIIRASAGTGKTFSLATRFIRLMMFQDVAPERILALTFSRAAAQEIYMKLLERLWKAAMSEAGAAAERRVLLVGLSDEERAAAEACAADWSPAGFANVLRRVIATQHHGTIATLDSFILRIVRSFPLEMGFQNAVDVLDFFGEKKAIERARAQLLDSETEPEGFVSAFKTVACGEFVRTCSKVLGEALQGWREFLLTHREQCAKWTASSMRAALGVPENPTCPDLSAIPLSGKRNDPGEAFVRHVARFAPGDPVFAGNKGGETAAWLFAHPEETAYSYETGSGKTVTVEWGTAGAAAARAAVRYMLELKLGRALDVVMAKLTLCRLIEDAYDVATRKRGQLTFSDFTNCQAVAEGDADSALALENLQFRFDARFDHWALDEFQDTSELQWKCLRRLVREAAQPGGGRTVMAVGDLKQSIYTWRGGNDAPFKEMMDRWPEFHGEIGEIVPNDVSFRYEKNTADFINLVFGPGNINARGVLGEGCAPAIARWLADDCWMEHRPDTKDGRPKDGDYVEVIAVKVERPSGDAADKTDEDGGSAAMKLLAPKVCELVRDLWREHERAGSTDTVGILVRRNGDGDALAERLRNLDLPVIWEGSSDLLDSPVVRAVLELLKFSEHPGDDFAWGVVDRLFPVHRKVFPNLARREKVSAEVAEMLSSLGLARTLQEIVTRLCAGAGAPDERTRLRLQALVRAGVGYEQRRDATAGVGDFVAYLHAVSGRETSASPHVVRILTIHRSKGLTLDHVIVPVFETGNADTILKPRRGTPLGGDGWVLDALPEQEAKLNAQTARSWQAAANERLVEQLRLYYVALTRARKSTHVFVCDDAHGDKVQFRDLLRQALAGAEPHECPYGLRIGELGTMPAFGRKDIQTFANPKWTHAAATCRVERRSPSAKTATHGRGWKSSAASLFGGRGAFSSEKGTAAHEVYAAIEWIDPLTPRNETERAILESDWRAAFVRTDATTALWREKPYELYDEGIWETGQFDRVVFAGERATVYDFKTNARMENEDGPAFARRMAETYAGQMAAYRAALARLTGLSPSAVATVLLLSETGAAVPVEEDVRGI